MSDTPKLMLEAGRHEPGYCTPTVPEVLAWLQEQNVGEEVMRCIEHKSDYDDGAPGCGSWMQARLAGVLIEPCQVDQFRRYLVVPLDPKEGGNMSAAFPACETCGGEGYVNGTCPMSGNECHCEPVACPDCVEGSVITDELVEAAARGLHDQECVADCPRSLDGKWLDYARAKLEAQVVHLPKEQT